MSHLPTSEIIASPLLRALELQNLGQLDESAGLFRTVLETQPNDPIALYSLSGILMQSQAQDEVLALTERGVQQAGDFPPMWFARAVALKAAGRREEALAAYDHAVGLMPDYTEALLDAAVLLHDMQRPQEALDRLQRLLAINPMHQSALMHCGTVLSELHRGDEAIAMFERLLAINPDHPYAKGLRCHERLNACDWADHKKLAREIVDGLRAGRRTAKPVDLMALNDNAADHRQAAKIFATPSLPKAATPLWNGEHYSHRRLRIAYLAPSFGKHPIGHAMAGVFAFHDKSRFEVIAVSFGTDDDSRWVGSFDRFIDARGQTSLQIAQSLRALEVDVAIDLAGHSSESRAEVFSHRAAPVQVNFLGHPGTMGTRCHDYILADRYVIPPAHQLHYSEKVAYLPDSYWPTDASLAVSEKTPSRAECGLPDDGIVFCSFSPNDQINPALFDVWMRILRRTPGSVLWLMSSHQKAQDNLRREARARGVEPSRIVFAKRAPRVEDHLARYRVADLFLDTSPCNARATAADALMVGLPVVTCSGDSFPSRIAGSLLHSIGMPELITASLDAYESLAVELAADPERLAGCSTWLMANQETHALFNTAAFTRHLEGAFLKMARETGATRLNASADDSSRNDAARRLHLGGQSRVAGWEVMSAVPGDHVDHLGPANDLSRFADASFDEIYASQVLAHFDYRDALGQTLREWCRVLKPGGSLLISVPDLEVLASLILDKSLTMLDRFTTMRMIFGNHVDADDHHGVGLTAESLEAFLVDAGFVDMERLDTFSHFDDTSRLRFAGRQISLNVRAKKPLG